MQMKQNSKNKQYAVNYISIPSPGLFSGFIIYIRTHPKVTDFQEKYFQRRERASNTPEQTPYIYKYPPPIFMGL